MAQPKILVFAGSARKESFNRKMAHLAAAAVRAAGGDATEVELRDYPLPLFDQDEEAAGGLPENAVKLKKLFVEHQGLLIASPEYNSSITPLLKNTLDWVSRTAHGEGPLAAYQGKVAGLVSASPGLLGGMRALVTVRSMLSNIGVIVLPEQLSVSKANDAFEPDGSLKDAKQRATLEKIAKRLVETVGKLTG